MTIGVLGKADTAWIRNTFQSCGNVDTVAHQIAVALLDNIAEMDADAKLDAALERQASVALEHAVLHLDGAAHRINNASELNEDAVARPLNDTSVMQSDGRVEQIAAERSQPRKRPLLVGTGKLAVADNICRQNRREFTSLQARAVPLPQTRVARLIAREAPSMGMRGGPSCGGVAGCRLSLTVNFA